MSIVDFAPSLDAPETPEFGGALKKFVSKVKGGFQGIKRGTLEADIKYSQEKIDKHRERLERKQEKLNALKH